MKLNPEELVVATFDTTAGPEAAYVLQATRTTCTWDPTAATQCFVCPAPSSPEDGC